MKRAAGLGTLVIAAGVAAMTACSGGSTTTAIPSNTPHIRSTAASLRPGLITTKDLRSVPDLPTLEPVPLKQTNAFENPDPRGPCGAKISQPDLSKGATAVFESQAPLTLSDTVLNLGTAAATNYLSTLLADARPGCPPYESTTRQGQTQTVTPSAFLDPLNAGAQRLVVLEKATVNDQTGYLGYAVVRRDGLIAITMVVSALPVSSDTIQALATQVGDALGRVRPAQLP